MVFDVPLYMPGMDGPAALAVLLVEPSEHLPADLRAILVLSDGGGIGLPDD